MNSVKTWQERQPAPPEGKQWFEWMQIPYMQAEIDDLRAALAERDAKLAALEEKRAYWTAQSDGWRTRAVKAECKLAALEDLRNPFQAYAIGHADGVRNAAAGAASVPTHLHAEILKAMRKAWQLGQVYWDQADSESASQNKKADSTASTFKALLAEIEAMLAAAPKERV